MKTFICSMILTTVLSGCTSVYHRSQAGICVETDINNEYCKDEAWIALKNNGVESKIGFVDFDNKGNIFNKKITDNVIEKIKEESLSKKLLIVGFVHGWNHNSAQDDTNVQQFKLFLMRLQKDENNLSVGQKRQVIGVYMGWQGRYTGFSWMDIFSFREKKNLGLETGRSVEYVIKELGAIRKDNKDNRLILVGHSFGGGVVYSAIGEKLLHEMTDADQEKQKTFADLVLLINPAVEANRFVKIQEARTSQNFKANSPVAMVSFTSEGDTDLSRLFPLGMKFFFNDQVAAAENKKLVITPYGLYSDYLDYKLKSITDKTALSDLSPDEFNAAKCSWRNFRAGRSDFEVDGLVLSHRQNKPAIGDAVLNVKVSEDLIANHNDIWGSRFSNFVRWMVGVEFGAKNGCPI